jgi:hypothetical protein
MSDLNLPVRDVLKEEWLVVLFRIGVEFYFLDLARRPALDLYMRVDSKRG